MLVVLHGHVSEIDMLELLASIRLRVIWRKECSVVWCVQVSYHGENIRIDLFVERQYLIDII